MENSEKTNAASNPVRAINTDSLDDFTRGYLEAALWSSTDDECVPLDSNYDIDDIVAPSLEAIVEECAEFQKVNAALLDRAFEEYGMQSCSAGHDFWLTRVGHGAGFWDRGMGDLGRMLTDASKQFGSRDILVGDDGKLHFC